MPPRRSATTWVHLILVGIAWMSIGIPTGRAAIDRHVSDIRVSGAIVSNGTITIHGEGLAPPSGDDEPVVRIALNGVGVITETMSWDSETGEWVFTWDIPADQEDAELTITIVSSEGVITRPSDSIGPPSVPSTGG